jgi:hypothetical protein
LASVDTTPTWRRVAAGYGRSCAIKDDGSVWCWTPNGAPARLMLGTAMTSVSLHHGSACARGEDGSAWCWDSGAPTRLGTRSDWASVMPGTCGVALNGTLYCWGSAAKVDGSSFSSVPSEVEPP